MGKLEKFEINEMYLSTISHKSIAIVWAYRIEVNKISLGGWGGFNGWHFTQKTAQSTIRF